MLAAVSSRLAEFARRWVPDPFVIALGLTVLAVGLGLAFGTGAAGTGIGGAGGTAVGGAAGGAGVTLTALAAGWFARFSAQGTLSFTFQMALMLIAGTTLARAPSVNGALARLADIPRSTGSAAALTAFVAMSAALLNWGFGLVAGAVLAQQIGARARAAGRPLNYPLVGAAGYTGLMVWHGGLSGSAPLKIAEGGPLDGVPVPLDGTILSPLNLALSAALLVFVPLLLWRMAAADGSQEGVVGAPGDAPGDPGADDSTAPPTAAPSKPSDQSGPSPDAERFGLVGRLLMLAVVALGVVALAGIVGESGWLRGIGLNTVNLTLVLLGLLLFGTPLRYGRAFGAAVPEAGGILLQFPFYFGILGVLEAGGLVGALAEGSVDLARSLAALGLPVAWCFDTVTFFSAGLVNLFVPSGGGQWAVQGTIVAEAAAELGVPLERAVMALAYGDEWTNMLQPFWALALLGITGLTARDILGYTLTVMLAALPVYLLAFALF